MIETTVKQYAFTNGVSLSKARTELEKLIAEGKATKKLEHAPRPPGYAAHQFAPRTTKQMVYRIKEDGDE
jgi:hypothetical protein